MEPKKPTISHGIKYFEEQEFNFEFSQEKPAGLISRKNLKIKLEFLASLF